ncbi:hypothetical protein [Promicromonospora soli]
MFDGARRELPGQAAFCDMALDQQDAAVLDDDGCGDGWLIFVVASGTATPYEVRS